MMTIEKIVKMIKKMIELTIMRNEQTKQKQLFEDYGMDGVAL